MAILSHSKIAILLVLLFVASYCEANYIELLAGSIAGYNGDGGLAVKPFCKFKNPAGLAFDSKGNMYISDKDNHIVRKIDKTTKIIRTVAGIPTSSGYTGDNGLASSAKLTSPGGIFIDPSDNIYFADSGNNVIRKINASTNIISTIAGTGQQTYAGDGGDALSAKFNFPTDVQLDAYGNIYIVDAYNSIIRKINNVTNVITTLAGIPTSSGNAGDGSVATSAKLSYPESIHIDSYGNIFISDTGNNVIRKIENETSIITTIAEASPLSNPTDVCFDSKGNMFIADKYNHVIRRVDADTNVRTTVAGTDSTSGYSGDGGIATSSKLNAPIACVFDSEGNLFFTENDNHLIRKVNLTTNIITTEYGSGKDANYNSGFYGDGVKAGGGLDLPKINSPRKTILDKEGRILICDTSNHVIRRLDPKTGIITTIVGTGQSGYSGDGGLATSAKLRGPYGATFDSYGNLYIADSDNNVIRMVNNETNIITTIAGNNQYGYSGDNGLATLAQLSMPGDVVVAPNGDVYISDTGNHLLRKVDRVTGIITTIAGSYNDYGYTGDGGLASGAKLNGHRGLVFDSLGNLLIADRGNEVIRKIDLTTNIITTIVGTGQSGYSGDGGLATSAKLRGPFYVTVDRFDNIFISDTGSSVLRFVDNSTKIIYTIAGVDSQHGFTGDFGEATSAHLNYPNGLVVDNYGSVIFPDLQNHVIRKVSFRCNGVLSNNNTVCGGHGSCSFYGVCNCYDGYFFDGTTCRATCFSRLDNDTNVCSGHGSCIFNDVCSCTDEDFGGPNCDVPKCFGIIATNPDSCSGFNCSAVDTCICPPYRFGEDCSQFVEYANYTSTTIAVRSPDRSNIQVCNAVNCIISATSFAMYGSDMYVTDMDRYKIWRIRDGMAYKYLGNSVAPSTVVQNIETMSVQSDSIAFSNSGEFYFTQIVYANNQNKYYVLKINNQRTLQVLLGTGNQECTDNMLGTQCQLSRVSYLTFDSADGLYFAGESGSCIKMMNTDSRKVYHVAGNCLSSGSAVGSFASTTFNGINDLTYKNDILYVLERAGRVIKALNLTSKTSSIVVGSQSLTSPIRMSLDSNGGIYICDFDANLIKYYNGSTVVNYAGTGSGLISDNPVDGTALLSAIMKPSFVKVVNDIVYIATGNGYLKKVVNGKLYAVVGSPEWSNDGNLIKYASVSILNQVTATRKSIMYFDNSVMKMDKSSTILSNILSGISLEKLEANSKEEFYTTASTTSISHYSATGQLISKNGKVATSFSGDGLIGTCAYVNNPKDLFFRNGNIYYLDIGYKTVRKLNITNSIINLGISTTSSYMYASDNFIIISTTNNTFVKYDMSFVKQAEVSFSDIPKIYDMYYSEASNQYLILNGTACTVVDQFGNLFYSKADSTCTLMKPKMENGNMTLYFYDQQNSTILKVNGSSTSIEYISDSSFANLTQFLVFNESTVYFTKSNDAAIYQLDMNTNTISLFLGNSSFAGYMDDTFENCLFTKPTYLTQVSSQQFVVADSIRLRLVDLSTRKVSTIAGGVGDGEGNFATAYFYNSLMKTNYKDELLIIDTAHKSIRKVSGNSISTIAGKYKTNKVDAMSNALTLSLSDPSGVCEDEDGNVYVSDRQYHVVRKIYVNGTVSIIAGKLGVSGYSGDNGDASQSLLKMPSHLRCSKGSPAQIFILDSGNTALRKILTNNKIITISNEYATVFDLYETDGSKIVTLDSVGKTIKILNGVCLSGFSGDRCDIWSCNDIPYSLNATCNKHGNCTNLNTCQCRDGWSGSNCEKAPCFGISGSDPRVCSNGNGTCIDVDTCSCRSGRIGIDCSLSTCLGIPENETIVCGGHGGCSAGVCICNGEWSGSNCSIPLCFGLSGSDGCNQHGSCDLNHTCQCDSQWFGANCSVHSCNGTRADDNLNVCNGHGQCVSLDTCQCNSADWSGQFCEQPNCFGLNASDPLVCSGHGQCVGLNTCQCNSKWFGANCSIHSCNGTRADDNLNTCNGKGQCISLDVCTCTSADWSGQFCEKSNCFGLNASDPLVCSGNGDCVGLNNCQCDSYWHGINCSIHSCNGTRSDSDNTCNGHGSCYGMDKCQCNSADWSGQFCEKPNCFGLISSDPTVCSSNGQCIGLNTCQCNSKWFGTNCSVHSCGGISGSDSSTCSSHGNCLSMDTCYCFNGYNGSNCERHTCYGKSNDDPSVCSSKGVCSGSNVCSCLETLIGKTVGQECSSIKCIGPNNQWIDSTDSNVCSKHGACQFNNSTSIGCQCSQGFAGEYCQWNLCYGISENSNQVCSGHGSCSTPNQCTCHDDDVNGHFTGSQCEKCIAPYSGINCNTIEKCNAAEKCNSHGTCDDFGFCTCYQNVTNGFWNGTNCHNCQVDYFGEDCLTQFLSTIKFNNQGSALLFKMSNPNHFESLIIDCKDLLENEKISSFGSNPICSYANKTTNEFIIELDQDHSINVNDQIKLNRNVFNRISKVKDYASFNIETASQPSNPIISISQKNSYSSCENVQLYASESYSLDRKQLSFKWEIVNSNLNSLSLDNSWVWVWV